MQTAVGIAGLLGFVLATSVDARQPPHENVMAMPRYECELPYAVDTSPAYHGFGAHGGFWSSVPPVDAIEASCTWVADQQQIPATLEHYLARLDGYNNFPGWTWISSGPALDAALNWSLNCEWLPAGCTPETCANTQTMELPPRQIIAPRDPAVAISYVDPVLEDRTCIGLGPKLRLETRQPFDPGFWQDGGLLRVGYADGNYFVTTPDPNNNPGSVMSLVPPPASGETWFGVEVVRGDGVVLDATRFDLGPAFWDSVIIVEPPYGRDGTDRYDTYEEPRRQGCHRGG